MGSLFSRGTLSLFLTLACAGGAVVVSCAGDAESLRVGQDVTDSIRRGETLGLRLSPRPAASALKSASAFSAVMRPQDACPAAVAPAVREFEARCVAKTATRGDLIALKKFIAASAIDGAAKTNLTRQARKVYQESKKRK